jgi:hypothetical protein
MTGAAKLSTEDKEEIGRLREKGLTYGQIARKFGVSAGTVSWHCLKMGVESPRAMKSWDGLRGPATMMRNGHVIRRFSEDDDARLLEMERSGATPASIARALGRAHNTVIGRLMTLARRDERRESGR